MEIDKHHPAINRTSHASRIAQLTIGFLTLTPGASAKKFHLTLLKKQAIRIALISIAITTSACVELQTDARYCIGATRDITNDERIAACTRVIASRPQDRYLAMTYRVRGNVWSSKRDYDRAIVDYDESLHLDPNSADSFFSRGSAWLRKDEYDLAIADFDKALRLNPRNATAYSNRGTAWGKKGNDDRAIADFDEAVRLNPKLALAFNNRGISWSNKREYDRAIVDYDEAVRLDPSIAFVFSNRGNSKTKKREYSRAIADYQEAQRLDPRLVQAYRGLAWLLATAADSHYRDGGRAVENALKACNLTGWKIWADLNALAAAYAEAGSFSESVRWQEKAIELMPEGDEADEARDRLAGYRAGEPFRE